jgi:hypothetical protein
MIEIHKNDPSNNRKTLLLFFCLFHIFRDVIVTVNLSKVEVPVLRVLQNTYTDSTLTQNKIIDKPQNTP